LYHTIRNSIVRINIVLDASKGYVPIEYQMQYGSRENDRDVWQDPWITEQLQWKSVNDHWVPVSIAIQTLNDDPIVREQLTIDWQSVNEPIPDRYFTEEDLDIAEGTVTFDATQE
jgi:hypothetical protein